MLPFFLVFFLLVSSIAMAATSDSPPIIGATFNPNSPDLLPAPRIVSSLRSSGLSHLLLVSPPPSTLRSFLYSPINLLISLPSNLSSYSDYLSSHLLPFHPRLRISALLLPFPPLNSSSSFLSSFRSLNSSLHSLNLPAFPISTVLPSSSLLLLSPSSPSSAARFSPQIRPVLRFLSSACSPIFVSLSPFHLFRSQPHIPLGFAIFCSEPFIFRDDPGSGLRYRNLFDEMLDSVFAALEKMGYGQLKVVVTGPGWPTAGEESATVEYAREFNQGLVEHVRKGMGTPMRRGGGVGGVFVHEVFDEMTGGEEWERHWGIWYRNLTAKYDVRFLNTGSAHGCGGGAAAGAAGSVVAMAVCLLVVLLAQWL